MSRLPLTVATGDYDRVRALLDGRIRIEGCDVNYVVLPVEECFHRAWAHQEFDVAEIGFSSYIMSLAWGTAPYVAVPAFLSRSFRHSAIYVRDDRGIEKPRDLEGKLVGVPSYEQAAGVWVRGLLKEEYGVTLEKIQWIQAGIEEPGRRSTFSLNLPAGFPLSVAPEGATLTRMLADGDLDAVITARPPSCFDKGHPRVRRLFPDYREEEREYFRRRGVFPIMHTLGIRRPLVEKHPWLAASVFKAFGEAKRCADKDLREVTALKIGLPWLVAEVAATEQLMGNDFWPYGVEANRKTIETAARYGWEQGLLQRPVTVEEMFPPSTVDLARV